jgi:hypothetical protein
MGRPKGNFVGEDDLDFTAGELIKQPTKFGYLMFSELCRKGNALFVPADALIARYELDDEVVHIEAVTGGFFLKFIGFADGYHHQFGKTDKNGIPVASFEFGGKVYTQWDDSKFMYTCVEDMKIGTTGFIDRYHVEKTSKGYQIHAGSGVFKADKGDGTYFPVRRKSRHRECEISRGVWVKLNITK